MGFGRGPQVLGGSSQHPGQNTPDPCLVGVGALVVAAKMHEVTPELGNWKTWLAKVSTTLPNGIERGRNRFRN